jgi:hypothetical protein
VATIDLGDLLRAELAAEDARKRSWPFAISTTRWIVIGVSFAATLGIGISLLVGA